MILTSPLTRARQTAEALGAVLGADVEIDERLAPGATPDGVREAVDQRGETVVAVSHADPIKAAVAAAMGTHLDLFQRIVVSPCSITAVTYTDGGPIVLAVNSTGDDLARLVPS